MIKYRIKIMLQKKNKILSKKHKKKNPLKIFVFMFIDAFRFYKKLRKRKTKTTKREIPNNSSVTVSKRKVSSSVNAEKNANAEKKSDKLKNKKGKIDIILNDKEIIFLDKGKVKNIKKYEFPKLDKKNKKQNISFAKKEENDIINQIYYDMNSGLGEDEITKKYNISYMEFLLIKSQKENG